MKKIGLVMAMFILATGLGFGANPVTVDGSGAGDFLKVQDAIYSWTTGQANAGETPPFVINVVAAQGPYDESMTLNDTHSSGTIVGDLVIQSSTPGTPAELRLQLGLDGGGDGIWVYQSKHDVTFKDLLFCPSQTGSAVTDDMVKIDENAATTPSVANWISFYDCVFSDIDAAGNPAVRNKADLLAMDYPSSMSAFVPGSALGSGDMLMKWWGDSGENLSGVIQDCVFWVQNGYNARIYLDGSPGESILVKDSVFATGRSWHSALQTMPRNAGSTATITGTQSPKYGDLTKCTAILSAGWHAIWCGGYIDSLVDISNVLVDNEDIWGTDDSRPIACGNSTLIVSDSILKTTGDPGMIVDYPVRDDTFDRVTIHMPGVAQWLYTGGTQDPGSLTFTDCIISGAGLGPHTTSVSTGGIHLVNCGIVTSGPDAISSIGTGLTITNAVNADPEYASYDRKSAAFLDVTGLSYAGAASTGKALTGGADYLQTITADAYYISMTDYGLTAWPGAKKTAGRTDNTTIAGDYVFQVKTQSIAPTGVEVWNGMAVMCNGTETGEPAASDGIVVALRDNAGAQTLGILSPGVAWYTGAFAWSANTWYSIKFEVSNIVANTVTVRAKIWADGALEPGAWLVTQTGISVTDATKSGMLLIASEGTAAAGTWGNTSFDNVSWNPTTDFDTGFEGWTGLSGTWYWSGTRIENWELY